MTQTAGGFIWVTWGHCATKTAAFATSTLQKRLFSVVGVSGFEPEASWTRTKRDTKLRHTPIDQIIIMRIPTFVKSRLRSFADMIGTSCPYNGRGGMVWDIK